MNPLDALLVPPALVKRALEDLHDIAQVIRRVDDLEPELRLRAEAAADEARLRLDALSLQLAELNEQLAGTRAAVEPLAGQIAHMERQLDELQEEMKPIGDLAEKVPGNRRRRSG